MDLFKKNWFTESSDMWPGGTFSFEVKEVLHSEKSEFQDILVLDTTTFGRVLVLDGIVQCSQKDEFSYQASPNNIKVVHLQVFSYLLIFLNTHLFVINFRR